MNKYQKGVHVSSKTIYQINAKDFVRLFGVHEKTAYRDLKEAAGKLYERSIVIRTKRKRLESDGFKCLKLIILILKM